MQEDGSDFYGAGVPTGVFLPSTGPTGSTTVEVILAVAVIALVASGIVVEVSVAVAVIPTVEVGVARAAAVDAAET